MSSTSNEGPNTASTGSMMSSTEPRVQQAVPAVQTCEMVGVLKSIKSVEAVIYCEFSLHILPKYSQYS